MAWRFIKQRGNCTKTKVTSSRLITSEIKYSSCLRHKGNQGEKKRICTQPSTLGGATWSPSRYRRFTPWEKPDTRRTAGFVAPRSQSGRFGKKKKPSPFLGFEPPTIQLITQSLTTQSWPHVQESSQVKQKIFWNLSANGLNSTHILTQWFCMNCCNILTHQRISFQIGSVPSGLPTLIV